MWFWGRPVTEYITLKFSWMIPANNADLMLAHCVRRWPNIDPTWGQCLMLDVMMLFWSHTLRGFVKLNKFQEKLFFWGGGGILCFLCCFHVSNEKKNG